MPPLPPTNLKYFGDFDKYFYLVTKVNFLCDTCIIKFGIIAALQRNLLRKIIILPRIKSLGIPPQQLIFKNLFTCYFAGKCVLLPILIPPLGSTYSMLLSRLTQFSWQLSPNAMVDLLA